MKTLFFSAMLLSSIASASTTPVWLAGKGGLYTTQLKVVAGEPHLAEARKVHDYGSGNWLDFHPSKPVIYSSWREGDKLGLLALKYQLNGDVEELDRIEIPHSAVTHFSIHSTGRYLVSAHYGGKATTLVSLNDDGSFHALESVFEHEGSSATPRQHKPLPHWAGFSPDESTIHVPDLGTDEIWSFKVQETEGSLALKLHGKHAVTPGMGPRHLSFHPNGRFAYLSEEIVHQVTTFAYDSSTASFTTLEHLEAGGEDLNEMTNNVSEVRVHPNGRFLYIGNRGRDSIAVFTINPETGRLTYVENEPSRGVWPRNFNFTSDGRWLLVAGQYSNTLSLFSIDEKTGELVFARQIINVPGSPRVLPLNR